jgi:uncharacterized lipoprotein YehR (DUF1307 family)
MDITDQDIRDFFLKSFPGSSLNDELPSLSIKESLSSFVSDLDLTKDFFDLFTSRLSDKRYILSDIFSVLQTPFTELLKTLKALQKIIESYFSENNLKNNSKLRNLIMDSPDGFVGLGTFLKYKNVKVLTNSEKFMAKSLEDSNFLEVSADKKNVRVAGRQPEESQIYYYNLDTSQAQINYSSIAEGLALRPTVITKIKYITMLAGNSRFVAYFKPDSLHKVDLTTGEDKIIAQIKGLSFLDLRTEDDLFVGVIDKAKIIIINLVSSVQTFEYKVTEGTVEKVLFHPTDRNLLVRFSQNEVVIFRINTLRSGEITWFKVVPMKGKIINVAICENLLASAVGQGQVQVLNIETDQVLFSYCPHTYNTMMYSSNITLHFITPNFLLTSGRSQNELCLAKIDSNQRTHILTIQSLSRKHISVFKEFILISDPNSSNVSLVIVSEVEDLLKFTKIIDYKLDSNCLLAFIGSSAQFHVVTKNDFRAYFTNIDKKIDDKVVIENTLDSTEITNSLNELAAAKVKVVSDKIGGFCKMNVIKKALADAISEGIDKNSVREIKAISEGVKKCVVDSLAPGIQSAVEEMMSQVFQCSEMGIKEFADKELELDSVFEVLQRENYQKVSLISDLTDIYGKNCMKHLKKLEKLEENFKEKLLTVKNKEPTGAQEKLNILLAQGDFESALGMVISSPSKLYSTLAVINPSALLKGKKITQGLQNRILKQFLIFPPTLRQLKNSAEWMENLIQYKTWTSNEKEEAKKFLKNHPLAYLSSFIIV